MILLSPYAAIAPGATTENPKNYPYWHELIVLLKKGMPGETLIQVGVKGEPQLVQDFRENLSVQNLRDLLTECTTWISVDSFFQHLGWSEGKKGVVIFSRSDPLIFGHRENINLLKSREYLRPNQFLTWAQSSIIPESYVPPEVVLESVKTACRLSNLESLQPI